MSLIVTANKSTDFTNTEEQVLVEGKKVFKRKFRTKFFNNAEQIPHVINDLVVNKGFILDKHTSKEFIFKNSVNPNIQYKLYPKELYGEYEEKELIADL
jgi:hypothetical protein